MRRPAEKLRQCRGAMSVPLMGALAITAIVVVAGLGIVALVDEEESTARGSIGIEEILEHRGKYLGERVTIRGPIDEILNQKAFTVASPDDDRPSLLVFADKPLEAQGRGFVSDDEVVVVEGEVHYRDSREIEWRVERLDDSTVEVADDQPVLLASRVRVVGRREAIPAGPTPEELTKKPSEFLGQLVTVAGEAERVISERAFILEPGLLVVGRLNALSGVEKGEFVEVTGPYERFSSFEQLDRRLDGRLLDRGLRRFVGGPVLIARAVDLALPVGEVSRGVDEESIEESIE